MLLRAALQRGGQQPVQCIGEGLPIPLAVRRRTASRLPLLTQPTALHAGEGPVGLAAKAPLRPRQPPGRAPLRRNYNPDF